MLSKRLKAAAAKYLASRGVYVSRAIHRGPDPWEDIERVLGWREFRTFIDVGANAGQSVEAMAAFRPEASIWAIEPQVKVYRELSARYSRDDRIRCFNLALGAANGQGTLKVTRSSLTSYLDRAGADPPVARAEIVSDQPIRVQTLDAFCDEHDIREVDFLKIDAEGADLDVLEGAEKMLLGGRVFLAQCECGMHPDNRVHVPFEAVKAHLEARGFRVFGIYEQAAEWLERKPFLRRVNAVFLRAEG